MVFIKAHPKATGWLQIYKEKLNGCLFQMLNFFNIYRIGIILDTLIISSYNQKH